MSKSKNNGVDPQTLIDRYGADTVRLYTMFTAPPEQSLEWSDEGRRCTLPGVWRWARASPASPRLHRATRPIAPIRGEVHAALQKALFDYERQQYNTVVSACMTMVNALNKLDDSPAAVAPARGHGHCVAGCWRRLHRMSPTRCGELGYGEDIQHGGWPQVDESALVCDTVEYVVQVNGRCAAGSRSRRTPAKRPSSRRRTDNDNARRFTEGLTVRNHRGARQAGQHRRKLTETR